MQRGFQSDNYRRNHDAVRPRQQASGKTMYEGMTVVVTGGGRGLGLGIARRFGQAGFLTVIAESDIAAGDHAVEMLQAEGWAAQLEPLDVRDPRQSSELVDRLVKQHGRIDVWVNNAGISKLAPAETMPLDFWDDSIAVMLTGTFYCSQAAGQHMLSRKKGVIVNIASVTGMMHHKDRAAYSTAKAGVIALTEALGVEWAARGVRVVGVAPGVLMTEMTRETISEGQGTLAAFQRRTPMQRLGEVTEVAEAVFYLASDEASYVTAETMRVDGGWVAYQLF